MTTQYIGSLSVSTLSLGVNLTYPVLIARLGELNDLYAELQAKIASIQAQLTAIASVSIPDVPSLTAALQAALAGVAQIVTQFPAATVSIAASLTADVNAAIALAAAIQVKINALVTLIADLDASLGGAGIAAYSYEGRADRIGTELGAALSGGLPGGGGPSEQVNALLLACASPNDWAKLGVVLKVS